jgi:hypothetical protein
LRAREAKERNHEGLLIITPEEHKMFLDEEEMRKHLPKGKGLIFETYDVVSYEIKIRKPLEGNRVCYVSPNEDYPT